MEERKRKETGFITVGILIVIATAGLTGSVSWFLRGSATETVRNIVVNMTGSGILVYIMEVYKKELKNPGRILFSYLAGLFACAGGAFLPSFVMPLLSFGLIFMLLSNFACGICAYALFCINITLLSSSATDVFFYFFITGLFAMAVYVHTSEDDFQIVRPLIMISCISVVLYTALSVLKFFKLTVNMVINPAIGLFLNIFILSIALYVYKKNVVVVYKEKYKEINDTEFALLRQLKNQNKDVYFLAIHTAYLSDRIAGNLGLDRDLVKCGAYYRRIGILMDENYYEKNRELMEKNKFPPDLIDLVEECSPLNLHPKHKEAVIVLLSDMVISSITEQIHNSPEAQIDYKKEIDSIISDIQKKAMLNECNITVNEFEQVQKYFKEETLYYDFLR